MMIVFTVNEIDYLHCGGKSILRFVEVPFLFVLVVISSLHFLHVSGIATKGAVASPKSFMML